MYWDVYVENLAEVRTKPFKQGLSAMFPIMREVVRLSDAKHSLVCLEMVAPKMLSGARNIHPEGTLPAYRARTLNSKTNDISGL